MYSIYLQMMVFQGENSETLSVHDVNAGIDERKRKAREKRKDGALCTRFTTF